MIAIVEEQTNAAELDNPDPKLKEKNEDTSMKVNNNNIVIVKTWQTNQLLLNIMANAILRE